MRHVLFMTFKNYSIVERWKDNGEFHECVVAKNYNKETETWDSGAYFNPWNCAKEESLADAMDYLMHITDIRKHTYWELERKLEEFPMSIDRLNEIAGKAIDGLLEDDRESALEYFDYEMELTDEEKQWFGIVESED